MRPASGAGARDRSAEPGDFSRRGGMQRSASPRSASGHADEEGAPDFVGEAAGVLQGAGEDAEIEPGEQIVEAGGGERLRLVLAGRAVERDEPVAGGDDARAQRQISRKDRRRLRLDRLPERRVRAQGVGGCEALLRLAERAARLRSARVAAARTSRRHRAPGWRSRVRAACRGNRRAPAVRRRRSASGAVSLPAMRASGTPSPATAQ